MNENYLTGKLFIKMNYLDTGLRHLMMAFESGDQEARNKLIELFNTYNDLGDKFVNYDSFKVIGNYRIALFIARKSRKIPLISNDIVADILFKIRNVYHCTRSLYSKNFKKFDFKTIKYLKESANLGNADAQYILGNYDDKELEIDNKAAY